jgi:flagellar biosynthesis/type III secretory pathway protein FliH
MISLIQNEDVTLVMDDLVIPAADVAHFVSFSDASEAVSRLGTTMQSRIEAAEKTGFEKGFGMGRTQGLEKAGAEVSQHLLMLQEKAARQERRMQDSVAQLAVQIVRKIAENLGPAETVAALAATASRELLTGGWLVVQVHPSVLEIVEANLAYLQNDPEIVCRVEIRADESLKPFDCLLETEFGTTVAGLDGQLESLEKIFRPAGNPDRVGETSGA